MKGLSQLQTEVFAFLVEFFNENDQLPPVAFIAFRFAKHANQIQEMLVAFEKKDLIEKNTVGKWRFKRAGA